jgi:hypothetical protein
MNDDLLAKALAHLLDIQLRRVVGWLRSLPATFVRRLRETPASWDAYRTTRLLKKSAMERGIGSDELARRQGYADHRDFYFQNREMFLIKRGDPTLGLDR